MLQGTLVSEVVAKFVSATPQGMAGYQAARGVAAGCLLAALIALAALATDSGEPVADLSWSNSYDDGSGILGGQQHGVTRTIQTCGEDTRIMSRVQPVIGTLC